MPIAQSALDEAFGLAVSLRPVGPCGLVANAEFGTGLGEVARVEGRSIASGHAFDLDVQALVVS